MKTEEPTAPKGRIMKVDKDLRHDFTDKEIIDLSETVPDED